MVRFHVEIVHATPLLEQVSDAREAFDRIWEMIPKNRPKRLWCFMPERGLFIKGRTAEVSLSRKNLVRSRRIATEIKALNGFEACGLPVPEIVAWGAERRVGITTRSFLMLRLFENVIDLERYVLDDPDADRPGRRQAVFPVVGRLLRQLHDAGCIHRDLSDRNILVHLDGEDPTVRLIDCPHGKFGLPASSMPRARREDLFRITRSLMRAGATDGDLVAMLEEAAVGDVGAVMRVARQSLESGVDRSFSRWLWQLRGR